MIFYYGTDLPKKVPQTLNHEVPELTNKETEIICDQIRKNSRLVEVYLQRLDLLVNKEKYPQAAIFIKKMRRRMELLIEENDTFRKVLWKHYQVAELQTQKISPTQK